MAVKVLSICSTQPRDCRRQEISISLQPCSAFGSLLYSVLLHSSPSPHLSLMQPGLNLSCFCKTSSAFCFSSTYPILYAAPSFWCPPHGPITPKKLYSNFHKICDFCEDQNVISFSTNFYSKVFTLTVTSVPWNFLIW